MPALYPLQDTFVRGEVTPRLHARASLELYRAGLSLCENFITLPHGGIRKRGCTYFVGEIKNSAKAAVLVPFVFSVDQAYALEIGDFYLRVYAYGARVGTVELVTPWPEAALSGVQYAQSGDVMWFVHDEYPPQVLTRNDHTDWTLEEFIFNDGPYGEINTTETTLTPSDYGALTPIMTSNSAPSGTVTSTGSLADAWDVFDKNGSSDAVWTGDTQGFVAYELASGSAIVDAYYVTATDGQNTESTPISWKIEGSNDGSTWAVLDTRSGESGWSGGETRFFEFLNKTPYSHHRFRWLGVDGSTGARISEIGFNKAAASQTAFDLTASGTAGINDGAGFQTTDVGRTIRLLGSDGQWRWARIVSRTSSTVVTIQMHGHALPDLSPITNWRMSAFQPGEQVEAVTLFEERLVFGDRFSVYGSVTGDFDNFAVGEEDDDALQFENAGGGQMNSISWLADADGFLMVGTAGGIRALSGSGIDEALTPSSFKNRKSRTHGCAPVRPIDAGSSFLYVTRSRRSIAELVQTPQGRFSSDDIGQISDHIPKKGVIELAFQTDPDPLLWFPLDNGELGGYTHQPSQEVRGMHRHRVGGVLSGADWPAVERCCVTPGQEGVDDVWMIVRRTIGGTTKRYIEIMQAPFEYGDLMDAFQVDCGLTYEGAAAGTFTGLSHLNGQTVDALAGSKVYKGLVVSGGSVTLPGGATATKAHVGLPVTASADTLQLDIGARDGSLVGRKRRVTHVILSLLETDTTGLQISSLINEQWEPADVPTNQASDGLANLFTGDVKVKIDDSWSGKGQVRIRHTNPTPCTVRAITPVFEAEP